MLSTSDDDDAITITTMKSVLEQLLQGSRVDSVVIMELSTEIKLPGKDGWRLFFDAGMFVVTGTTTSVLLRKFDFVCFPLYNT